MLIDSNLVFLDSVEAVSGASAPVALTSFWTPRREEPVPVSMKIVEGDLAGVTSLGVQLQQACAQEGPWEDVPGAAITISDASRLVMGGGFGWRFLPAVSGSWLRLNLTVEGSSTGEGRLFAAIVREDELPWEAGMFIDGGVVRG